MTDLYYEAHITIEPVFGERLEKFQQLADTVGFRVADLLMQKRPESTPERSQYDSFCTGRSPNLTVLESKMTLLIEWLQFHGFQVWRYKIEDTLMDSRYEDVLGVLNKEPVHADDDNSPTPAATSEDAGSGSTDPVADPVWTSDLSGSSRRRAELSRSLWV